ncbi:hypothetical protein R50073_44140 [Maricurvus nonylphenolicus]|uniref:hypothetical protein n=1 Tax=Maricurvus nonylphenolicus TaxID=1008307 RepID=UPI0036F2B7E6
MKYSPYSSNLLSNARTKRLLFWLLLCLYWLAAPAVAENAIHLAMHPPPHLDKMTVNQARSIFSMRLRAWPDGSPITVFVMEDSNPNHKLFVRSILALLPHQLRRQWDRLVYTGIGQAPIEVKDEHEMIQRLVSTPGSIGYIRTGKDNETLRILPLR